MDFYDETMREIVKSGHSVSDIDWIGSEEHDNMPGLRFDIDEFLDGIRHFVYDNGYGRVYIPVDLKVVFKDGDYLWRNTYDGAEWWEASRTPDKPNNYVSFEGFLNHSYDTFVADRIHAQSIKPWKDYEAGISSSLADARDLDPTLNAFMTKQEEHDRRMSEEYYWD